MISFYKHLFGAQTAYAYFDGTTWNHAFRCRSRGVKPYYVAPHDNIVTAPDNDARLGVSSAADDLIALAEVSDYTLRGVYADAGLRFA